MRGITLIAIGKSKYAEWAFNMALFCRYYTKLPVQLIADPNTIKILQSWQLKFFKYIDTPNPAHYNTDEGFTPAKLKMWMYEYLRFDETLYMDVDGYLTKDPEPLFDQFPDDYYCTVIGKADKQRPNFPEMKWADKDYIFEHYDLPDDTVIYGTNSSMQIIRKGAKCAKLFAQIQANFENKIPLRKLTLLWGGSQADELYLNIALGQLKLDPSYSEEPLGLITNRRIDPKVDHEQYYHISLFGIKGHTHPSVYDQYEVLNKKVCRELLNMHRIYKVRSLLMSKWIHN